jgi:CrcB protein
VAGGGALRACLRYGISLSIAVDVSLRFPWATLFANAIGCFAIGVVWGLWANAQWFEDWGRSFLLTGLLGGFTTFSTFSLEFLRMFESERLLAAISYLALSILSCLLLVWLGRLLAKLGNPGLGI